MGKMKRAKMLKNIIKKNTTWCVKLIRKLIFLLRDKKPHRSRENWIFENELHVIGTFRFDYEYEIGHEYDFQISN